MSRFTSFAKDFGYQMTKIVRSGHDCTGASHARSPCNFRHQTDIAIPVFREMSKNVVFARYHFCSRLQR